MIMEISVLRNLSKNQNLHLGRVKWILVKLLEEKSNYSQDLLSHTKCKEANGVVIDSVKRVSSV